jgi:hypothetical protein
MKLRKIEQIKIRQYEQFYSNKFEKLHGIDWILEEHDL